MKNFKCGLLIGCFAGLAAFFMPACGEDEMTPEAPPAEVMSPERGEEQTLGEAREERKYEEEMTERSEEREDL